MKESIFREKSYKFVLRIIKLYKYTAREHKEFILSKQILRSGTSVGANIEESIHAQSKVDFIRKLAVAQKEVSETNYRLRLLRDSEYLSEKLAASLIADCEEIQKMLTASIKTVKGKLDK